MQSRSRLQGGGGAGAHEDSDSGSSDSETHSDPELLLDDQSTSSREDVELKVAVQNCRSICKLIDERMSYSEKQLLGLMTGQDVLILTETWLKENDDKVKKWFKDNEYNIISVPRAERHGKKGGGGVAIAHSNSLNCRLVTFEDASTFEYIVVEVTIPGARETVHVVGIYRPHWGARTKEEKNTFLKELRDLLCDVYDTSDVSEGRLSQESEENDRERKIGDRKVIIGGDFNLWVDKQDERDKAVRAVMRLLRKFKSAQHVSGPTHNKGHTLDLVFANHNVEISDVSVKDHGISDHYAVYFTAEARLKKNREKKE